MQTLYDLNLQTLKTRRNQNFQRVLSLSDDELKLRVGEGVNFKEFYEVFLHAESLKEKV